MQNVAEKLGLTKFVSMQNHWSLLYRHEELEMVKYCQATGVGIIPWSPLAGGRLTRPLGESSFRRPHVRRPNPLTQNRRRGLYHAILNARSMDAETVGCRCRNHLARPEDSQGQRLDHE